MNLNATLIKLLLNLLLHCVSIVSISKSEILSITSSGTWSCSSSSTECTMIVDSKCSDSTFSCPNNGNSCNLCQLICNGPNDACKDSTFYSHDCKQVNIITNASSGADTIFKTMVVVGPRDGNLNITIKDSGKEALKDAKIFSQKTKNIFLDLYPSSEDNLAENMIINATNVENSVQLNLFGDSKKLQLYCPKKAATKCIINCIGNTGSDKCKEIDVYTKYGFINNLQLCLYAEILKLQVKLFFFLYGIVQIAKNCFDILLFLPFCLCKTTHAHTEYFAIQTTINLVQICQSIPITKYLLLTTMTMF